MNIDKSTLKKVEVTDRTHHFGTTLVAKDPKPTHKYVQHLKNLRDNNFATAREICPEVVGTPISGEFVQFCKLGLAEKYTNLRETRVYYKITQKGLELLEKAGV